jgi:hypothetical protein
LRERREREEKKEYRRQRTKPQVKPQIKSFFCHKEAQKAQETTELHLSFLCFFVAENPGTAHRQG